MLVYENFVWGGMAQVKRGAGRIKELFPWFPVSGRPDTRQWRGQLVRVCHMRLGDRGQGTRSNFLGSLNLSALCACAFLRVMIHDSKTSPAHKADEATPGAFAAILECDTGLGSFAIWRL